MLNARSYLFALAGFAVLGSSAPGCLFDGGDAVDTARAWVSIAPIQCNGNAWEVADQTVEQWLDENGVDAHETKSSQFADAVCLACSCPTGTRLDILVDESDVETALSLGFVRSDEFQGQ